MLVLSACHPVPLPTKNNSSEERVLAATSANQKSSATKQVSQSTQIRKTIDSKPIATTEPIPETVLVEEITPVQRVQNAIELLKVGDVGQAQLELEAVLKEEPDNKIALNLQHQIESEPKHYFTTKTKIRNYVVQPGDSFSTLAMRFLESPLEFHILAKLNNYADPTQLKVGQIIKIPTEAPEIEPEIKPIVKTNTSKPVNVEYNLAKKYYDQGKYQAAIAILEPRVQSDQSDLASRDLLVLTYTKYAFYLVDKANLLEAKTILEKAVIIQPNNQRLLKQLTIVENQREADRLYTIGVNTLKTGNRDEAFELFNRVLKLQPEHAMAQQQYSKLTADVVDSLHKQAMRLYKDQELAAAIGYWDKLLKINPDHELAKLYRSRAIELQKKFDKY